MPSSVEIAIFCGITVVAALAAIMVRRKADSSASEPAVAKLQLRRDAKLATASESDSVGSGFDRWLELVLIRAGISMDRLTFMTLLCAIAFTIGGAGVALDINPLLIVPFVFVVPLIGMIGVYVKMKLRLGKFEKLFPTSLELLARATRAGENLENAFQIAADSCETPVKEELTQCVRQMRLGMPPTAVVADLARRVDSSNVHLLSHSISIHHVLGGRLAESLDRLSLVIHNRSECEQKIKSMTSIGRFAILSIVLMGFFVLIYLTMAEPDYISNLFSSSLGHKMLAYAAVSELIGLVWVGYTLKSDL